MSSGTLYTHIDREDVGTFLYITQPFAPEIDIISGESGEEVEVNFNQGYVFDYAQGGERVEVDSETFTFGTEEKKEFKLRIEFDHAKGKIQQAKIFDKEDSSQADKSETNFDNFIVESHVPSEANSSEVIDDARVVLDFAKFDGPSLEELYIRENIHLYVRGFFQMHSGGNSDAHGIINPAGSTGKNARVNFRSILAASDEGNQLSITSDDENIYFLVSSEATPPAGD